MAFPADLLSTALSNINSWVSLIVTLVVSTVVGGIVFLIVIKLVAKKLHDSISAPKAFLAILAINIINLPIIWGTTLQAVASFSFALAVLPFLPFLIWLMVLKGVFGQIRFSHIFLIALIGYILSIFVIPYLVFFVRGSIPF